MSEVEEGFTTEQMWEFSKEVFEAIGNFNHEFTESYTTAYEAAIAAGKSPLDAAIEANKVGLTRCSQYAEQWAARTATPGSAVDKAIKAMAFNYADEASRLNNANIVNEAQLAKYISDTNARFSSTLNALFDS